MQSFRSARFKIAGDIRVHVAFWHLEVKTKGQKTLVFEPIDMMGGEEIIVDQLKPYAVFSGELRPVRLFHVAMNIERVKAWANMYARDEAEALDLRNLYPFLRGEAEGWLQRCKFDYPEDSSRLGRTRCLSREMMEELKRQAILMPSLLNPNEYQVLGQVIEQARAA
ncbi:hypothetical protein [Hydrogenophaga sp. NFH-34]|uniref:hypothetical protein n=1 Tax=Hydrogenophaga sp. NFH-34 TaxID=2744446 RepID=UPI001F1D470B|nr:hypothetical protein [Hydrogenophaga sp. NFH-34]